MSEVMSPWSTITTKTPRRIASEPALDDRQTLVICKRKRIDIMMNPSNEVALTFQCIVTCAFLGPPCLFHRLPGNSTAVRLAAAYSPRYAAMSRA